MAPNPDRIWDLAGDVLAAIESGFASDDVSLPTRRYRTYGVPAIDCEELVVALEASLGTEGAVNQEVTEPLLAKPGHAMRSVRFAVWLLRCHPTVQDDGNPPTVTAEEEAAELVMQDAQRLLNVIVAAQRAGDLPACGGLAFEQWTAITPNGGIGGGVLRLRMMLQ